MNQVKNKTSEGMEKAKSGIDKLGGALEKVQQKFDKLGNSNSELSIKDKASQVIEKAKEGLAAVTQKTWSITLTTLDKATAPIKGIFNLVKNPAAFTILILGLGTDPGDLLDTFAEFEQSMGGVRDAAKNAKGFEILTEKAREMGRETTKSASEAADAMGMLASSGWDQKSIELGINPVLRLSEAADLELDAASDLVTGSIDSLGLEAEELEGFLDKISVISQKSNADMGQLIESFMEIGDTVKQNHVPLEEAGALIGVLANQDLSGAEVGTGLNSVLDNLTSGAGEASDAMKKLELSAFRSDGSFKGYAQTLKELHDKTKDMTEKQKAYYLTAIGGKMPLDHLQKLLSGVGEEYDDLKKDILDSKGAMEDMVKVKSDNIYGDMDALQRAFKDVKLTLMTELQPYIRKFIQWLTEKMPMVNEAVEKTSSFFVEKLDNMEKRIEKLTSTGDWKTMDLFGKISIVWSEVIIEPFSQWWSGTGKAWFSQKASELGSVIGEGMTIGLLMILGLRPQEAIEGAVEGGISVGAAFADGFLEGFDGKKVGEAILNGIKGIVKDAATLLPGGENASSTSILSAGLVSFSTYQASQGLYKSAKGIQGVYNGVQSRFGKKDSGELGSMVNEATAASAMNVSAQVVNVYGGMVNDTSRVANAATQIGTTAAGYMLGNAAMKGGQAVLSGGQALLTGTTATATAAMAKGGAAYKLFAPLPQVAGKAMPTTSSAAMAGLAKLGVLFGSKATTIGGAAAAGGLSAGGILAGGAGIISGVKDLYQGIKMGGEEGERKKSHGKTKLGMVGTSAVFGGIIGSAIPVVGTVAGATIGAGIGGIAALLSGNTVGDWFYDDNKEKQKLLKQEQEKAARKAEKEEMIRKEKEKQLAIEKQINGLKNIGLEISNTREQIAVTNQLKDSWSEIHKEMESGLLTEDEKIQKQEELKGIVSQLSELYPDLIDDSDLENGKLDEKIGKIQDMNALEKERQRLLLENQLIEAERNFDSISKDFRDSNKNLEELRQKEQAFKGDNRLELDTKTGELELYRQKLSNAISMQEEDSVLQEYETMIEQKKQEIDEVLQKMGVMNPLNRAFEALGIQEAPDMKGIFRHSYSAESIHGEVQSSRELINAELMKEIENNQKLNDQINQIYESSLQLIELNLGQPIEEAAESYGMMGEEQQKVFDQATKGISDLNLKFQELVKEPKYVDLVLKFHSPEVQMPSESNMGEPIPLHAKGGIMTRPHVGIVAEAGSEAIIPLTGMNRKRGEKLWEQTGRILGMMPEENSSGIFEDVSKNRVLQSPIYDGFFADEEEADSKQAPSMVPVPIDIGGIHLGGMNFTFDGMGSGDREGVIEAIREQMPGIADEVADTIAASLTNLFSNMKTGIA